jgi:N-acetyl-alpha-D-muramate 1-phosphate uridylyltransferase
MILAAGEGRRMRPLTDHTPKPLLEIAGKPLLEHHIIRLKTAGFDDLVVNASYLGHQIASFCGDGSQWGVKLRLSLEDAPLETAGGIIEALHWLQGEPFAVVNGDVFTDFPFAALRHARLAQGHGHLVLVANPEHHPRGDFVLREGEVEQMPAQGDDRGGATNSLTFSGIAVYDPLFFAGYARGKRPLKPLLDSAIRDGRLQGKCYTGMWTDVGTPERFTALSQSVA